MTLADLGFDAWFQTKRDEVKRPELDVARITRVDRERYLVRNEQAEVQAEPAGKLLYAVDSPQDLPSVGDWALVQYHNDGTLAIIHDLLPRRTLLRRKAAGHKVEYQIIAANIDVAFIMQSCDSNFNLRRMERYLVIARDGHIEPRILLSKSDLVSAGDLERMLSDLTQARIDVPALAFSSTTEAGLGIVRQSLESGKTYCLLGSSGVGKTTLLNHLLGREEFETNAVREKDGRGKHTTARRQLSVLENGALLIDTPGMRELGMIAVDNGIDESFADIHHLSTQCRFKDCSHTTVAGCAILAAVEHGELHEERYRSYIKLLKESQFHEMSYVERRKKDKAFGRMVNTALKQLRTRKPSV
jgi:ribosome biogenesis GTPase / thiamine phosphate phosphatase